MKAIEEEFPEIEDVEYIFPVRFAHEFNRLRARAVELERAQSEFREFMDNEAVRLDECASYGGEAVATKQEIFAEWAECCRAYTGKLPPAPDTHQPTPCQTTD
jgi:hypothetical protein